MKRFFEPWAENAPEWRTPTRGGWQHSSGKTDPLVRRKIGQLDRVRDGCGHLTDGQAHRAVSACQTSAAKRRQGSGTPLSSCSPRSRNVMPEPTTRSLTVLETKTSSGPARAPTRAGMWTARPARSSPRTSHSPVCRPDRPSIPRVLVALVMAKDTLLKTSLKHDALELE